MTIVYSADVFCDACGIWVHGGVQSDKPTGMARPAIAVAKAQGWSRNTQSEFVDLCPKCLIEFRKGAIHD
jgi:hypothetical protein